MPAMNARHMRLGSFTWIPIARSRYKYKYRYGYRYRYTYRYRHRYKYRYRYRHRYRLLSAAAGGYHEARISTEFQQNTGRISQECR